MIINIKSALMFCGILLITGCGQEVINISQLEERDGLNYLVRKEKPFSGKISDHYSNGQKKIEANFKNGTLEGLWTSWYVNGQKEKEGEYKKGKQQIGWSFWTHDGIVQGQVKDNDGNIYPTIKICDQEWMSENLNVRTYQNGDIIAHISDSKDWAASTVGAWSNYENRSLNGVIYGKLYNLYAVLDHRGLAPKGWHIASDADWITLEMCIGMDQSNAEQVGWRGTSEGEKLKKRVALGVTSIDMYVSNESGFSALLGGIRSSTGRYEGIDQMCCFWTSTEYNGGGVWRTMLNSTHSILRNGGKNMAIDEQENRIVIMNTKGFSVRCVKD